MHQRRQGEVQGTQAEDGEDVRGVDDEGVLGDGEDRRHAVHREDQVGQLYQHQGEEQRGGIAQALALAGLFQAHEEVRTVQLVGDPHMAADELQHRVVGQVRMGVLPGEEHLHAGEQQEGAEDVENPVEFLHQGAAHADHDGAQHDHADDAPEQHPVLVAAGNGEEAEDHRHDEDVVHGQRLLHQEARVELQGALRTQLEPDPDPEQHADAEVAAVEQQAFAHLDFMLVAVQHPEVEDQQGEDYAEEDEPQPGCGAEEVGEEKCL
ncbi:hypothetical protein D3C78_495020 [compost metagenome]